MGEAKLIFQTTFGFHLPVRKALGFLFSLVSIKDTTMVSYSHDSQ